MQENEDFQYSFFLPAGIADDDDDNSFFGSRGGATQATNAIDRTAPRQPLPRSMKPYAESASPISAWKVQETDQSAQSFGPPTRSQSAPFSNVSRVAPGGRDPFYHNNDRTTIFDPQAVHARGDAGRHVSRPMDLVDTYQQQTTIFDREGIDSGMDGNFFGLYQNSSNQSTRTITPKSITITPSVVSPSSSSVTRSTLSTLSFSSGPPSFSTSPSFGTSSSHSASDRTGSFPSTNLNNIPGGLSSFAASVRNSFQSHTHNVSNNHVAVLPQRLSVESTISASPGSVIPDSGSTSSRSSGLFSSRASLTSKTPFETSTISRLPTASTVIPQASSVVAGFPFTQSASQPISGGSAWTTITLSSSRDEASSVIKSFASSPEPPSTSTPAQNEKFATVKRVELTLKSESSTPPPEKASANIPAPAAESISPSVISSSPAPSAQCSQLDSAADVTPKSEKKAVPSGSARVPSASTGSKGSDVSVGVAAVAVRKRKKKKKTENTVEDATSVSRSPDASPVEKSTPGLQKTNLDASNDEVARVDGSEDTSAPVDAERRESTVEQSIRHRSGARSPDKTTAVSTESAEIDKSTLKGKKSKKAKKLTSKTARGTLKNGTDDLSSAVDPEEERSDPEIITPTSILETGNKYMARLTEVSEVANTLLSTMSENEMVSSNARSVRVFLTRLWEMVVWFLGVVLAFVWSGLCFFARVHKHAVAVLMHDRYTAFCFCFMYVFPYLTRQMAFWIPPWTAPCLWYAFLIQIFCTQGSPLFLGVSRVVLAVMILTQGVTYHSILLDLNGAERLAVALLFSSMKTQVSLSVRFVLCALRRCKLVLFVWLFGICESSNVN